ncbi:MAG: dTDP-glucose 4,6-dehydratase [Acidobacteriota bacterium]
METMVVTGGAGFIGGNFVRYVASRSDQRIVVVDKLTYAGSLETLEGLIPTRVEFVHADIADSERMQALFRDTEPLSVVNFAAETHVDRSIDNPKPFIDTNYVGTFVLLEAARLCLKTQPDQVRERFRFLQISTDEVYGTLGVSGSFTETTPYSPNSPYAASKAGADHLTRAYYETYGLPTLITNCSNNYGPRQYPEKLIPLMVLNGLEGKPLPIYGDGGNVRDWLYVEDHCEGIWEVLRRGTVGEKYNLGGSSELTNIEVVDLICALLQEIHPADQNPALQRKGIKSYFDLKTFVPDRPGHDRRYAIDASKVQKELGWRARHRFEDGLRKTVRWYLDHQSWCQSVGQGKYNRERLGLGQ